MIDDFIDEGVFDDDVLTGGFESTNRSGRRSSRRAWRWLTWFAFAVFTVAVLGAGWIGWWYLGKAYPTGDATGTVEFTVEDSDTIDDVVQRLADEDLVADGDVFEWYIERQGGLELTPGYYQIQRGAHMGDVLERLRTPPDETFEWVTFPEGFTVAQMGERLGAETGRLDPATFVWTASDGTVTSRFSPPGNTSLEGLLFPDTYPVSNADNEGQVVERMAKLMERVADQEDLEAGAEALGKTPYEVMIVASMIEREAKVEGDRAKIARVIYNRLELNMNLAVDATLYYGMPDFEGPFSELRQIDTPYNTYLRPGLPPTPIANPGRASIKAALSPAPNPPPGDPVCRALPDPTQDCRYLYYVLADADGSHAFAANEEQHQVNVDRARQKGLL